MSWTASGSGTQTATGAEDTLVAADTNNATFGLQVDLSNMANGDVVELRIYTKVLSTGSLNLAWKGTFANAPLCAVAQSPFVPSDQSIKATLKQIGPQYAAGASWAASATTITMSLSNPGSNGIASGWTVIDLTTGQTIGTVTASGWSGTTLNITAAAHASSGSSDNLMFVNLKSFDWKLLRQ